MSTIQFENGKAQIDGVSLESIAAKHPTPFYLYSGNTLEENINAYRSTFSNCTLCYAVKANSNLSLLKKIFHSGFGADIVSLGELQRALLAGCSPKEIVFSGVGKRDEEIKKALDSEILFFNVESVFEIEQIQSLAKKSAKLGRISLRINPNIDAKTNPHITTGLYKTKFGIAEEVLPEALSVIKKCSHLELVGLSMHLGSQITSASPFQKGSQRIAKLADTLLQDGFALKYLDMGGGLGIPYDKQPHLKLEQYAKILKKSVATNGLRLILEPGRSLIAKSGVLVTRVLQVKRNKKKTFVIVDGSMSELIRPVLYGAYHRIETSPHRKGKIKVDVVGPVCETGDFFALNRILPTIHPNDILLVMDAGAYGMSMASQYNSRPKPAEILIEHSVPRLIRRAESFDALWVNELF